MFSHQLTTETVPSIVASDGSRRSLNDAEEMRQLLERCTGYAEFKVTLPGTVRWLKASTLPPVEIETTLKDAVRSYIPEDRRRLVDAVATAIAEQHGFRVTARLLTGKGSLRAIEIIGDVRVDDGRVVEVYGLTRDITETLEQEALAMSRARLLKSLVSDLPVPVAVLDRALRLVDANEDWLRAYGLHSREAVLGRPIGKTIEVARELVPALAEALSGNQSRVVLKFYGAEDGRLIRRTCAVIPWVGGGEATGGVMLVYGSPERVFASPDIADNVMGRKGKSLLQLLETLEGAA